MWASESSVARRLGPPDMITHHERFSAWGHEYRATYTYLERGYRVLCADGWTRGVSPISSSDRPDEERQVRAYKEELTRFQPGDAATTVVSLLGPPDFVETYADREWFFLKREGDYRGEFEAARPPASAIGVWKDKYCIVRFRDNAVVTSMPLWRTGFEHYFHELPPHVQREP
jgi:hypothetical protein